MRITTKQVFQQLKADLIGKDSYRGVTLTYSWLANQFGHIGLGFIPSIGLYIILAAYTSLENPILWSTLIIGFAWTAFEAYNFLGPLLLKKKSTAKNIYLSGKKKYIFEPDWKNVGFDTATDVVFFWLGSFIAGTCLFLMLSSCLSKPNLNFYLWMIAFIIILLIYPFQYWYKTKMYLQQAQYPFQFRLSMWDKQITSTDKELLLSFLKSDQHKHLLVYGGLGTGKTSLAVGIATEHSIKHRTCSYTTAIKLYTLFAQGDDQQDTALWNWRGADLLIIDDINPGKPVKQTIVNASEFHSMMQYNSTYQMNVDALRSKKVIWVLGTDHQPATWETMIEKDLQVNKENILSIHLSA